MRPINGSQSKTPMPRRRLLFSAIFRKECPNMKATGMFRKVDELGRIVLPAEIRQAMDIKLKDSLEIYTEGDAIILKKYQLSCVFCQESENLELFEGKRICPACLSKIKAQF